MKPWRLVAQAGTPDRLDMRLLERDGDYTIRVAGKELMSTRAAGSEQALARLACAGLRDRPGAQVLIGGLGFGFTLRAALQELAADARVLVAELLPEVVAWNRDPTLGLAAEALADPRVRVVAADVGVLLRPDRGARGAAVVDAAYDAVLLDVDNGPQAMTAEANAGLYTSKGLVAAGTALRPGGKLAIWSAAPDERFEARLRRVGFAVEVHKAHAHGRSGTRHLIYLARLPEHLHQRRPIR